MQTSNIIESGGAGPNRIGLSHLQSTVAQRMRQAGNSLKQYLNKAKAERSLDFRNLKRTSLDSLRIP